MKRIIFFGIASAVLLSNVLKSQCLTAPFTESFNNNKQPSCIITSEKSGEPWDFDGINWDQTSCSKPDEHTGNSGGFVAKDQFKGDTSVVFEFDTIDVSVLNTPYLSFYYYMCGTGYSPVNILAVEAFDGTDWKGVDTIQEGFGEWTNYIYDLTGFTFGSDWLKIRFRSESGGSKADTIGDQGIDDISIIERPCFKPSQAIVDSITSNAVDVSWIENNTSTEWLVEYDTTGYDVNSARNRILVNQDTFTTISGIQSSTTYDLYIRSICAIGDTSERSQITSFTTKICEKVSSLSAIPSSNEAKLLWAENGYANQWEVEYDTTGFTLGTARNVVIVNDEPEVIVGQLDVKTTYDFYVRAVCGVDNKSEWSAANSFTTACGPAPTNLYTPIFSDISAETANIRWDENAKASGWIVEYDVSGFTAGSGKNRVVVADTFTTLSALTPSTNYEYYVRSICNIEDTSGYSVAGNFKTLCGIPNSLIAISGESNQSEISWIETGSATEWEIQYGVPGFIAGNGTSVVANSNPYTITGLNVSTDYEFYVRAICGIGDASLFSDVGSFTTGECDSVTNLVSAEVSVDSVNLNWTENGTAISWEVSYGVPGFTAGMGTQVSADTNNGFTLRGLDPNTDYDWYVRSICNVGDSSNWSVRSSFVTEPMHYSVGIINTEDINGVADSLDVYCWTSGLVMGIDLDGTNGVSFYITDLSSGFQQGISVANSDYTGSYVVAEGDSIRVRGSITQSNGLIEIYPDSISIISTAKGLPVPILVDTLNEETEARLIDLYDLVLIDGSQGLSYNMRAKTHKGDTIVIRIDEDTDINDSLNINSWVAGDTICRLVGVGSQLDNNTPFTEDYQVIPMRFSDIDTTTCINIPVGIDAEVEERSTFQLIPNPTKGEFTLMTSGLSSPSVQVIIRDINGRVLIDERIINANNSFRKAFDLSDNAKGLYFISIFDGEEVINEKLILQ